MTEESILNAAVISYYLLHAYMYDYYKIIQLVLDINHIINLFKKICR